MLTNVTAWRTCSSNDSKAPGEYPVRRSSGISTRYIIQQYKVDGVRWRNWYRNTIVRHHIEKPRFGLNKQQKG
jgi:hypothetical protein